MEQEEKITEVHSHTCKKRGRRSKRTERGTERLKRVEMVEKEDVRERHREKDTQKRNTKRTNCCLPWSKFKIHTAPQRTKYP